MQKQPLSRCKKRNIHQAQPIVKRAISTPYLSKGTGKIMTKNSISNSDISTAKTPY